MQRASEITMKIIEIVLMQKVKAKFIDEKNSLIIKSNKQFIIIQIIIQNFQKMLKLI